MVGIERVRPAWSAEELARIYATPHDHRIYGRGHGERVDATIALARTVPNVSTAADLSCGNAAILTALALPVFYLGDFAPGYGITGPVEETLETIPKVDLYVLSETLEHVDNPLGVLMKVRAKTDNLILSTPIEAWGDTNAEHYWAWSREGVESLMVAAGFTVKEHTQVDSRLYQEPYCYGIWWAT